MSSWSPGTPHPHTGRRCCSGAGSDAEDVVQEAFVKGHRTLSRYRGESSFRSWLMAIVANETRNLHRSRGRRDGLAAAGRRGSPHGGAGGTVPPWGLGVTRRRSPVGWSCPGGRPC
ncbi:RNA polymerase sigma factor [Micromonospora peucetia]|uniref:RNA polymerase sigma factor n=1 Tax=Micromonospora peucetia TaxID=47871 RepID=A0ABZ1EDU2_9ACTN|nr:RNA polymerase sigma factor [Micromonospora peucetia]MCX4390851.1 RNA polymerase sigma factor [Micromonospora peucetia]WSA31788.1 RNA polymerase sigma factor [Micromonospora peucetia]